MSQSSHVCPLCWSHGPPLLWLGKSAPPMPSLMADLEDALQDVVKNTGTMTKPELRHLFREQIRGVRSPQDPTKGLSSLSSLELKTRMQEHDLEVKEKMTKDAMIFAIRRHWLAQCELAKSPSPSLGYGRPGTPMSASDSSDTWEFPENAEAKTWLTMFSKRHLLQRNAGEEENMHILLAACEKHPDLQKEAVKVEGLHKSFLASKASLLEKAMSCQDGSR